MLRHLAAIALVVILAGCAATNTTDVTSPTAAPTSQQDLQEQMHECLEDAGWDGTLRPNGIYDYSYSEAQRSAFETASSACIEQIGGNLPIERTDAEWRDLYDFYLDSRQCLHRFGIETPPAPSFTVWVESGYQWTPYTTVSPTSVGDQWDDLLQACPQTPAG